MKIFAVLDCLLWWGRAKQPCTATAVANQVGVSTYRARKILHSLHELGLVDWDLIPHRPNVTKRAYRTTVRGRAVLAAYEDYAPPSEEHRS
jgi:DNA-binding IclR family transcriptional regulator